MSTPVVGLTGILGCGKSAAARFFAQLDAHIIDMDEAGRWAVENSSDVKEKLAAKFGADIFDEQHQLLRRKLGDIVFADADALRALNDIVHPNMLQRVRDLIIEAQRLETIPYIIVDAALILELKFDGECDATIAVTSPLELCLQRAIEFKNLTREAALERIASQMPQEQKAKRADFIIENDSTLDILSERVAKTHQQLFERFDL